MVFALGGQEEEDASFSEDNYLFFLSGNDRGMLIVEGHKCNEIKHSSIYLTNASNFYGMPTCIVAIFVMCKYQLAENCWL